MKASSHIPHGYHAITPILIVADADALIAFVTRAFDAKDYQLARRPDGKVWHADLTIEGSHVMISEAAGPFEAQGAAVNLYVPDVDETFRRAVTAGATPIMEPSDRFYGDRNAVVKDPTGITWSLATHIEDVPDDELRRREAEARKSLAGDGH
jgi:uncharacterized glyoxalase superfamily protein PhnB